MTAIAYAASTDAPRRRVASQARLRITPRGRAVLSALVLIPAALGILGLSLNAGPAAATSEVVTTPYETITVQQGESLWGIASSIAGDRDVRVVVADIVRMNALTSESLQPGQRLLLPY